MALAQRAVDGQLALPVVGARPRRAEAVSADLVALRVRVLCAVVEQDAPIVSLQQRLVVLAQDLGQRDAGAQATFDDVADAQDLDAPRVSVPLASIAAARLHNLRRQEIAPSVDR